MGGFEPYHHNCVGVTLWPSGYKNFKSEIEFFFFFPETEKKYRMLPYKLVDGEGHCLSANIQPIKMFNVFSSMAVQQNKLRKSKTKAFTLENEPKNKLSNPTGFHPSQLLLLR